VLICVWRFFVGSVGVDVLGVSYVELVIGVRA